MSAKDFGECADCKFWHGRPGGPWPDSKPAKECRRFPPARLWGLSSDAKSWGIAKHFMTYADDGCCEFEASK